MSNGAVGGAAQGRLAGKVAIITGGAGGVGEAAVRLFTKHGAKVLIADIADEAGLKLAESVGPSATFVHCDVSNEEDVRKTVDLAVELHGKLDILFNNAGTIASEINAVDYDMKKFRRVMEVNVMGVMHGIKHGARVMIGEKKGSIINTGSLAGTIGGVAPYSYTASKHAILGLTKNGAAELGKYGIKVNSISPAGMATNMSLEMSSVAPAGMATNNSMQIYDENREERRKEIEVFFESRSNLKGVVLKAEDLAEAALYLASDESKYVSGHNLVLDGGTSIVNHCYGLY